MSNETDINDAEEEYFSFLDKASDELLDFIFSEKTLDRVVEICENNEVLDEEKIENIAQRFMWVALGNLPKNNLSTTLEKIVGLSPETAKRVADEVNQFISSAMAQLKSGETQPEKESPKEKITPTSAEASAGKEEKPKRPPSKDVYREKIE